MFYKTYFRIVHLFFISLSFFIFGCENPIQPAMPGLDVLVEEKLDLLRGKRIGLVTNHTALSANGDHILDVLIEIPTVKITALFAPEHGIRGDREGGEFIESYSDSLTGILVYSLYGKTQKPTSSMLDSVDILLFDIQDIGARFYTYISTMGLAMEAAAERGIPFVVLDRPNPITGAIVEGPILKPQLKSFVGQYPIPIRHGLTVGELAKMINGEGWMKIRKKADLTVIPAKNWKRAQWFDQTDLPWIKTSPNMPTLESATLYPGMCLLEGLNISEGRGTYEPFVIVGAPWLDPEKIIQNIPNSWIYGIKLHPIEFRPISIPVASLHPKYEGDLCYGLRLQVYDRNVFRSVSFAIYLFSAIQKSYPNQIKFRRGFDRLAGDETVRRKIENGVAPKEIISSWENELGKFKEIRKKYLLYE